MTRAVPDTTRPCLRRVVSFLRPNGVLIGAAAGGVLSLQDTHYTRRTAATHCCCYRIKKDDIVQVYVDAVTDNVVKVEWTDTKEIHHGPCARRQVGRQARTSHAGRRERTLFTLLFLLLLLLLSLLLSCLHCCIV